MGRYSPSVTPTPDYPIAAALMEGLSSYLQSSRQTKHDRDADTTREITQEREGYRSGKPPVDATSDELASQFLKPTPESLRTLGTTPVNAPTGPALANHFETPEALQSLPMTMPQRAPARGFDETPSVDQGSQHPGAFDPATRTFGARAITAAMKRPAVDATRYTTLPSGGYIDEEATPRAENARDRAAQLAMAAAFRESDLNTRGRQASSLEDQRQQGRQALRSSINDNSLVGIALRAMLMGDNSAAHDSRAGANSAAHDARVAEGGAAHDTRVTNRMTTINGGGASDKPAAEANRLRAGAAIVQATGGSYDAAVDWLENTPEGQEAAKRGLRKDHLYAGLGAFIGGQQKLAAGLETGPGGMPAGEAATATAATRTGVTPARPQAPGEPTGMGGARRARSSSAAPAMVDDPEAASKAEWVKANPPKAGESREQYRARYDASKKPPTK